MRELFRQNRLSESPISRRRKRRTAVVVSTALIFGPGCAPYYQGSSSGDRRATTTTSTTVEPSLYASMVNVAATHKNPGIYGQRPTTTQAHSSVVVESTSSGTATSASPEELRDWLGPDPEGPRAVGPGFPLDKR